MTGPRWPLADHALVVTGAGRGIGAACARHCAELGASVMVNDLDPGPVEDVVAAIRAAGGTAVGHVGDVSSWDAAEAVVARCDAEFGALDGLLACAGIVRLARPTELDEVTLRRVVEVNLLGAAFCGVHAVRRMVERGHGSLLMVTSGSQSGWPLMSAYGASRGGVASLAYCWAMDLEGTGVRVNALSPVGVTRLRDHFREYLGADYQPKPGPSPERNAGVAAYLLSRESAPLTGQVVRVSGGELGLMTHPVPLRPTLDREDWTFDAVREAFATDLAARSLPLGSLVPRAD